MRPTLLTLCCAISIAVCGGRGQTGSSWPRRALIEAPVENSLDHRYLSKQVYGSAVVDDMETDGNWSVSGIGTIAYTTERAKSGKRSLRFRTSMRDEAHIAANRKEGSFAGGQGGSTSTRLKFSSPQDWSRFNRISLWVYVHPTSMRAYSFTLGFNCDGAPTGALDPVPSHFVQDLKPGEWNHVVWEIPEFKRDKVTGFGIAQTLRGHDPEDEGIVTYDFDQIEVQRVDAEPYEGWEVAPGKIAFEHVGYRPSEEKLALVSNVTETQFDLVDAGNKVIARYPVKTVENRRGRFQVLDFTSFTKPGRYSLRIGKVAGRPFEISDDLWFGTIEKALNAYYGLRCGFDVPGVHRVCHQDWQGSHEGRTKIINGGWHDAGDLSQGSHRTGASTYAMLQIYDQLRQRNVRPDLQARVLEEARWGLDWLLKTRFGNGYRITWALMRIYTDNKVGTIDDVIAPAQHIAFENFLFSAAAGYASRVLKNVDPQKSAESLRAAEEDFRATLERRSDWSAATHEEAAFGALASVELYRATGKQVYTEQAARFGRLLMECQEQRFVEGIPLTGYFYNNAKKQGIVHDFHLSFEEAPLLALRALCETYPDHADWMEWYGAALLHSEYFFRQGAAVSEPYQILPNSVWNRRDLEPERTRQAGGRNRDAAAALQQFNAGTRLSENYRLRVFPIWPDNLFHGNTAIHMAGTAGLAAAAQLRNQPALENLVRRQLQWVFGGNPFSESLMYGEGYDYQPLFVYCLRNLVGGMPVGMDSRQNDSPYWPAVNRATYKEIWVVPSSRLLWTLASTGMPARVTGSAPTGAAFREMRTGTTTKVPAGKFAVNLEPGDYTITYGAATRRLAILAGGRYELPLDPRNAVNVELSSKRLGERVVEVTARLRGSGAHKLDIRTFNGSVDVQQTTVDLVPGRGETLSWKLKVEADDKPWVLVAIPDGDLSSRTEAFGTVHDLPRLE